MDLNKERTGIEEKFFNICAEVIPAEGLALYDLEYISGSATLKIFIMDPKTNTAVIEDCVKIDRAMSPYFEADWVPDDIVLEVSSPGVYRNLKSKEHFESAVGEFILVGLEQPLDPAKIEGLPNKLKLAKKLRAKLLEIKDEGINLDIDGFKLFVTFKEIKKASLDPDL